MIKLFAILCVLLSVAVAQAQIVKFPAGAPTMGTCGTSPSVSGNNSIGTITVDEYLAFVFAPVFADWTRQAGVATADAIIQKLKEAIAAGDDAKLQAVKDTLGVVDAVVVDPAVKVKP